MAEYKAEETLVIEVGSEYVTKSKPFKVQTKLSNILKGIRNFKKIVIGKNIVAIGEAAFAGCGNLCEIDLAEVAEIGARAFERCAALKGITLPKSVKEIGCGVFAGCTALTNIVIPAGVTKIGGEAFKDCSALTGVVIPKRVTEIGYNAFAGCKTKDPIIYKNCLIGWGGASGKIVIPDGVTKINSGAFSGCTELIGVTIPDSVTTICYNAFAGCKTQEPIIRNKCLLGWPGASGKIVIPNGVKEIDSGAFSGCTELIGVTIPEGVT
ncbi:MAG: leucine-rich repeat domain-containing protein, partial [Clostridia bacterium]|nr:leucine-rich repeat domain-containing protein [Clostridia bacterium]